ncbi:hypothetical protein GLOTRDRAFT_130443 [Gloeophyllum trabeum ATCC 11539]|uniref:Uncharacterized protein n=1 Tax=Gloeophyllum trabeum (strain ATCC 11539 / FP-39264 / Madison 617) TaxID=670483 RepID=S7RMX9_GLOTA|nr:uncharacterized protein GLOTRDRAFT_130443 [Gloeophyllum trabeum ATCC 11539]EPQ54059.1 hypothetical protein GLOTRDRAFT_130443 [Gloeophyllum trabeum ATCC 11539]
MSCNRHLPNFKKFIVGVVLWNVGFAVVVYAAHLLTSARIRRPAVLGGSMSSVLCNLGIIGALLSAVVLGVRAEGTLDEYSWLRSHYTSRSRRLRHSSTVIFLVVSLLVWLRIAILLRREIFRVKVQELFDSRRWQSPVMVLYVPALQPLAFLAIPTMLLVRSLLLTASTKSATFQEEKQTHDGWLFYLLGALPELVAVMSFAVPGLVPESHGSSAAVDVDIEINDLTMSHHNPAATRTLPGRGLVS